MPQPRVAGRFELLRLLGSGASGSVHAAHDHRDQRLVALKQLHPGRGGEPAHDAQARFEASAAQARSLEHADIVRVFDVGCDQGTPWLAMEAVPGADLGRYAQAARLLPEPLVLQVGERLALALAHAHARGVVHRDLKPANVLAHWPTDTLKIVDFGLARGPDAQATRTGLLLGTPAYMAPELLAGALPGPASDFYALGVLMFQLFTGRLPFEAATLGSLLRQVAHEPAPDLRGVRPGLPADVAHSVARLLVPDAGARTSDGAALAARWQALRTQWPGVPMSR